MYSKQLREYASKTFQKRLCLFGEVEMEISHKIEECRNEERVLLYFLYGTMPLRDVVECEFAVLLEFVSHGNMLRETMQWCRSLPEDIFLHYVLYYRINSEDIVSCRPFFYQQLQERVKGKSIKDAALEVNYWCAENAAYESSDERTIAPMTVYKSGKGRCGEESTFTVAALRSIGIPSRQIYTPKWAHCDDNHAWVEVYVDGEWNFLGACEPEPVLNKGWFSNASSRALLIHGRTFGNYFRETQVEEIGKENILYYQNNTSLYAKTKYVTITVLDQERTPVRAADVVIQILNMAEFSTCATLSTNAEGITGLTIGLGNIILRAVKGIFFTEVLISTQKVDEVTLILTDTILESQWKTDRWEEFEIQAPLDYPMNQVELTKEQKEENRCKVKRANGIREERIKQYYVPKHKPQNQQEENIWKLAKGNFEEIYRFLDGNDKESRLALLKSLPIKDYKDVKAHILEEHLEYAAAFSEVEGYEEWILCPRIYVEELKCYRKYIQQFFTREQIELFVKSPLHIWKYIQEHITYYVEEDYPTLLSTPVGCLKQKQGNPMSQQILFVAICRTFGIPARLNKVTLEAEWKHAPTKKKAVLHLLMEGEERWDYYQTWTIAKWDVNQFKTLNFEKTKVYHRALSLELESGTYRIMTTNRTPNGNQYAAKRCFALEEGMEKIIKMNLRQSTLEDLLVNNEIPDFDLENVYHERQAIRKILQGRVTILAFLEEGVEPTEHVLNEMLEYQEDLRSAKAQILVVVKEEESLHNPTLAKTLQAIPKIQVFYDDFSESVEQIARRMYVDPEKLPLLLVMREGMKGIYACSGYHVGSIGLIRRILSESM